MNFAYRAGDEAAFRELYRAECPASGLKAESELKPDRMLPAPPERPMLEDLDGRDDRGWFETLLCILGYVVGLLLGAAMVIVLFSLAATLGDKPASYGQDGGASVVEELECGPYAHQQSGTAVGR